MRCSKALVDMYTALCSVAEENAGVAAAHIAYAALLEKALSKVALQHVVSLEKLCQVGGPCIPELLRNSDAPQPCPTPSSLRHIRCRDPVPHHLILQAILHAWQDVAHLSRAAYHKSDLGPKSTVQFQYLNLCREAGHFHQVASSDTCVHCAGAPGGAAAGADGAAAAAAHRGLPCAEQGLAALAAALRHPQRPARGALHSRSPPSAMKPHASVTGPQRRDRDVVCLLRERQDANMEVSEVTGRCHGVLDPPILLKQHWLVVASARDGLLTV